MKYVTCVIFNSHERAAAFMDSVEKIAGCKVRMVIAVDDTQHDSLSVIALAKQFSGEILSREELREESASMLLLDPDARYAADRN